MKIEQLMTPDVITIGPEAPLKEAARRMIEARVSGLVVTDNTGTLVGVVTEADFVKDEAGRRAKKRARLLRWLDGEDAGTRPHRTVGDVMTRDVLTLSPDADHSEAARVMKKHNVKRLPVVAENGDLVGLVSRSDILRAFARADADIIQEIETDVMRETLWIDPELVQIRAEDGNVTLVGRLETKTDATLLAKLVGRLDGVVSVDDRLDWDIDNTTLKMVSPPPSSRNW